jgi:hypothetical protein
VSTVLRRIFGSALLLVAVLAGLPSDSAGAQGFVFESIKRYDVQIQIEPSGSILVTETIDYDFGSVPKHGIFRDIPERLHYDDTYDRIYRIDVISVKAVGAPADYEVEHQGGGILHIRIGDPDVTVSGEHVYTIVYRVDGALNGFPDHDELYWNAIGADWNVQIDQASARVTGPAQ